MMQKRRHALMMALFLLAAIPAFTAADEPAADSLPEVKIKSFLAALKAHDYQAMTADFDAMMIMAMPPARLQNLFETEIFPKNGDFVTAELQFPTRKSGYLIITYQLKFQRGTLAMRFVFRESDPACRLAGLWYEQLEGEPEGDSAKTLSDERYNAGPGAFSFASYDGFTLDGKVELPEDAAESDVRRVMILIHGSGPLDLNENAWNGPKPHLFRDLSWELTARGFAVLRYNKRSYQVSVEMKKDPAFAQSEAYKVMESNWLKAFVEDARALIVYAQKRFPQAQIYLLGHSQGTYVGLMAAHLNETVKGVALVGYCPVSADTIVFEQVVYRSLRTFRELDADRDGMLDPEEIGGGNGLSDALRAQLGVIDGDKDGRISEPEFMAGQYANLVDHDLWGPAWRRQEAEYPTANQVLKEAGFKVAFFLGLLDNQTPYYYTRAVQIIDESIWKKGMLFVYYPGLGHGLDPRAGFMDMNMGSASPEALKDLAAKLDAFFE